MATPKQATWLVRKIFDARKWRPNLDDLDKFSVGGKFSIKQAYQASIPQYPKVQWKTLVLLKGPIPRQQFILWMAIQNRLATTDRLAHWGIQVDPICKLCTIGATENHRHLFFECSYSKFIWQTLLHWMEIQRPIGDWNTEVQWMAKRVNNKNPKWTILGFVFTATVYHVWRERNARRFQQTSRSSMDRTREIALQIHIAGQQYCESLASGQ
ncbi:uncharacterized protein LOC132628929 [Lycium barbarum]|uniref:uncharacterized protein LOC132628929 n=1 Tax=Lycium barbarum TaxID=112863 RepID=UPI00293F7072|nr:uncharacterized protein LOC132628929 [Lycium barbarum]